MNAAREIDLQQLRVKPISVEKIRTVLRAAAEPMAGKRWRLGHASGGERFWSRLRVVQLLLKECKGEEEARHHG